MVLRLFPLPILLLALAPDLAVAANNCEVAKLACGILPAERKKADEQCQIALGKLSQNHLKSNKSDFVNTRIVLYQNFREKLHGLCSLKYATAVALKQVEPTKDDCNANSQLMQLGKKASSSEEVIREQKANHQDAENKYLKEAGNQVRAGERHENLKERPLLQEENRQVLGASTAAELTPNKIPENGLLPSFLHLWKRELATFEQPFQSAAANLSKNGAELRDRCKSLVQRVDTTGGDESARRTITGTDDKNLTTGAGDPATGNGAGGAATAAATEESWASRNQGLLIGGGVGAAAIVGAIFYQKHQDKKKLSADTQAAVDNWETENSEQARRLREDAEKRENKLKDEKFADPNETSADLSSEEIDGQTVKFFPPVAIFLKETTSGSAGDKIQFAQTNCPAHHELLSGFPNLSPKDSFDCSEAKEALKEIFKGNTSCAEVQTPVEFFAGLPPKQAELTKMGDIHEVLRIFGPALARAGLLGSFKKQSYYDQLSSVLVKVRLKKIREDLEKRQKYFLQANSDLKKGGRCLRGTAEEQARAKDLFGRGHNETLALLSQLEAIENAGTQVAQEDYGKILAKGRKRAEFPYPSMSDQDRIFLSTSLGAFLWRARGGGLFHEPEHTNVRRLTFTHHPWEALGKVSGGDKAGWVGTKLWFELFAPWGKFHDMGRLPGNDKISDLKDMRNRGVEQLSGVRSTLKDGGFDVSRIDAAGPMMGDCYWYGWEKLEKIQMGVELDNQRPYQHAIAGPTQWGEFCTGASFGYAISRSMLDGY